MIGLQRLFKMMDDDGSNSLSLHEFSKACKDFKIGISEENVPVLFGAFDKNGDGTLSVEEFIGAVRNPLSVRRRELVERCFDKVSGGNDEVDMEDLKKAFNGKRHPDVMQGKRTEQNILCEFLETLEAFHGVHNPGDENVDRAEFIDYYTAVGSGIDDDQYFQVLLTNSWNLKQMQSPPRASARAPQQQ